MHKIAALASMFLGLQSVPSWVAACDLMIDPGSCRSSSGGPVSSPTRDPGFFLADSGKFQTLGLGSISFKMSERIAGVQSPLAIMSASLFRDTRVFSDRFGFQLSARALRKNGQWFGVSAFYSDDETDMAQASEYAIEAGAGVFDRPMSVRFARSDGQSFLRPHDEGHVVESVSTRISPIDGLSIETGIRRAVDPTQSDTRADPFGAFGYQLRF